MITTTAERSTGGQILRDRIMNVAAGVPVLTSIKRSLVLEPYRHCE